MSRPRVWAQLVCVLAGLARLAAQRPAVDEAWDLLSKGERARAVSALERILQADPRDAAAHLMLGSLWAEDGKRAEALAHLEEGVRLRPRSAQAHHALGEALRNFGERARGAWGIRKGRRLRRQLRAGAR